MKSFFNRICLQSNIIFKQTKYRNKYRVLKLWLYSDKVLKSFLLLLNHNKHNGKDNDNDNDINNNNNNNNNNIFVSLIFQVHRNDHSLFLWNYHHLDFPVHSFVGHRDVILNFDWRNVPDTNKEMQLVRSHFWKTLIVTTIFICGPHWTFIWVSRATFRSKRLRKLAFADRMWPSSRILPLLI